MSAFTERADRLAGRLKERELDVLLVTQLVNVRYLTGFTGTNAIFVITPERRVFITDFRYVERARREVPDFERLRGRDDLLGAVTESVGRGRLGFDDAHMTVQSHAKPSRPFSAASITAPSRSSRPRTHSKSGTSWRARST